MEKEQSEQQKDLLYYTSNKDINEITKIMNLSEDSGVFIGRVIETVQNEIKKQECTFLGALLAPLATSLVQSEIFSVVKGVSGRGAARAGREYMDKTF